VALKIHNRYAQISNRQSVIRNQIYAEQKKQKMSKENLISEQIKNAVEKGRINTVIEEYYFGTLVESYCFNDDFNFAAFEAYVFNEPEPFVLDLHLEMELSIEESVLARMEKVPFFNRFKDTERTFHETVYGEESLVEEYLREVTDEPIAFVYGTPTPDYKDEDGNPIFMAPSEGAFAYENRHGSVRKRRERWNHQFGERRGGFETCDIRSYEGMKEDTEKWSAMMRRLRFLKNRLSSLSLGLLNWKKAQVLTLPFLAQNWLNGFRIGSAEFYINSYKFPLSLNQEMKEEHEVLTEIKKLEAEIAKLDAKKYKVTTRRHKRFQVEYVDPRWSDGNGKFPTASSDSEAEATNFDAEFAWCSNQFDLDRLSKEIYGINNQPQVPNQSHQTIGELVENPFGNLTKRAEKAQAKSKPKFQVVEEKVDTVPNLKLLKDLLVYIIEKAMFPQLSEGSDNESVKSQFEDELVREEFVSYPIGLEAYEIAEFYGGVTFTEQTRYPNLDEYDLATAYAYSPDPGKALPQLSDDYNYAERGWYEQEVEEWGAAEDYILMETPHNDSFKVLDVLEGKRLMSKPEKKRMEPVDPWNVFSSNF
jgi:hypothetical protein